MMFNKKLINELELSFVDIFLIHFEMGSVLTLVNGELMLLNACLEMSTSIMIDMAENLG